MARIKTKTKKCKTFEGADVVRARELKGYDQRTMGAKCELSFYAQRKYEDGKFVIIPAGYKPIEESSFWLIQEALV